MSIFTAAVASLAVMALLLVSCSKSSDETKSAAGNTAGGASTEKICVDAADRYEGCLEKVLGKEARAMAHGKRKAGIAACKNDSKTVAMYRKCLPAPDCDKFDKCMMDYAKSMR